VTLNVINLALTFSENNGIILNNIFLLIIFISGLLGKFEILINNFSDMEWVEIILYFINTNKQITI
jgi:hypothetical protein